MVILSEIWVRDPEFRKTYPGSGPRGENHRILAPAPQHCFPVSVMHNSLPTSTIIMYRTRYSSI
jgi:hypothetical protein